jgi:hypothetical protein
VLSRHRAGRGKFNSRHHDERGKSAVQNLSLVQSPAKLACFAERGVDK